MSTSTNDAAVKKTEESTMTKNDVPTSNIKNESDEAKKGTDKNRSVWMSAGVTHLLAEHSVAVNTKGPPTTDEFLAMMDRVADLMAKEAAERAHKVKSDADELVTHLCNSVRSFSDLAEEAIFKIFSNSEPLIYSELQTSLSVISAHHLGDWVLTGVDDRANIRTSEFEDLFEYFTSLMNESLSLSLNWEECITLDRMRNASRAGALSPCAAISALRSFHMMHDPSAEYVHMDGKVADFCKHYGRKVLSVPALTAYQLRKVAVYDESDAHEDDKAYYRKSLHLYSLNHVWFTSTFYHKEDPDNTLRVSKIMQSYWSKDKSPLTPVELAQWDAHILPAIGRCCVPGTFVELRETSYALSHQVAMTVATWAIQAVNVSLYISDPKPTWEFVAAYHKWADAKLAESRASYKFKK